MNDWQKDWWQQIEKSTVTVEKFFNEINQAVESFAEEVTEALEEFNEQLQETIVTEVDRFVEDWLDYLAETNLEVEFSIWDDIENFVNDGEFVEITTEIPTENHHPSCIGCRNYHGQAYNGQILVCAMHPYGVEDNSCPDWQE